MRTDYKERVKLPPFCTQADEQLEFRTRTGLVLARGYVRVEFGGRGPYIEFRPSQIIHESIKHVKAKWVKYFRVPLHRCQQRETLFSEENGRLR
jgi:hypothetical protein